MELTWFSRLAKFFLYWIIMILVATGMLWTYVYMDSIGIIRDRLNDLSMMVAEENCLSEVYIDSYNQLLTMSETPWLTFENKNGALRDRPYQVKAYGTGALLFSYNAATQRGKPIHVELTGSISLPFFIGVGQGGLANDKATLDFDLSQEYVVMGLKFYKDKE